MKLGGSAGAPKFPMPVNLDFLLYYGFTRLHKMYKYMKKYIKMIQT